MQQNLHIPNHSINKPGLFSLLNELCLIPKSNESEEEFLARVDQDFPGGLKEIHFLLESPTPSSLPEILLSLHINMDFLPWTISSNGLRPWHLGVFESDGTTSQIQIHPRAKKKNRLIEVLSHEATHYLRRDCLGPYEELLCYLTSKKTLYRRLGFFLVSPECKISLLLTFLCALFNFWAQPSFQLLQWGSPLIFGAAFLICRYRLRAPFQLLKHFSTKNIQAPLPLLLRLTCDEIDLLFENDAPTREIENWAQSSFRWKFLHTLYLRSRC